MRNRTLNNIPAYSQTGLLRLCLIVCLVMSACKNDINKVKFFDRQSLPEQSLQNADITRTSSGNVQLHLQAPTIEQYSKPEHKTIYPKGFLMTIYNQSGERKASIQARYGISYDDREIMEAKDSVVVIDYKTGDTSYLKTLVWNSGERRIYSEEPLKSINGNRITYGDGFESDENFEHPLILRQRGTIEWADE